METENEVTIPSTNNKYMIGSCLVHHLECLINLGLLIFLKMFKLSKVSRNLFLLLCLFLLLGLVNTQNETTESNKKNETTDSNNTEHEGHEAEEEIDETFGPGWCEFQETLRHPSAGGGKRCEDQAMKFDDDNVHSFLAIFLIIGWGALVRSLLKATGANLPYTVILLISGLLIGALSTTFCKELSSYTAVARTPPQVILNLFLPVLIFESAFAIPVHTFLRSLTQILVAAFPGMIISTMFTAGVCLLFLPEYGFTFVDAALFGSIISATDPVAVVAILSELGTSELLGVMIDGESLLNDGVAILLYKIFEGMVLEGVGTAGEIVLNVLEKFVVIAIGGPIFGWVMAKIAIFSLSRIFNDATVEITITLVAAYLTFFIGDHMIGVSGVMAVVVLGLTMSSEKTAISPEVESSVHHFWEMLGYLANTVLFVLVGIIITETAINNIQWHDLYYLIFMYIALNIIRLSMLMILAPILRRIGYGLKWENLIIMTWGGLRGAVGLCLAIQVYNGEICNVRPGIGAPFLFQTAGVVFLTLIVNGTTTKMLLETLKLTEISAGRIQDMTNATKQLTAAQIRSLTMLKHDRFLADANWQIVERFTRISDPYKKMAPKPKIQDPPSIISLRLDEMDHVTECDQCHNMVVNEPTHAEFVEMTEEARLRILKALKVSYWRQFEQGVLTELAVQILAGVAETIEDRELVMIHTKDLRKYWTMRGIFYRCRKAFFKRGDHTLVDAVPRRPSFRMRRPFWWLATRDWFDGIILFLIVMNLIPVIWEIVLLVEDPDFEADAFFYANLAFTILYTLELIIKVVGRGIRDYVTNKWNYVDVVVLILSYIEIGFYMSESDVSSLHKYFVAFKMARLVRIVRLPRYLWPRVHAFVDRRLNEQLFLGYDVGKGFVTAVDDVLKFLPQMVDHKRILAKLRRSLERARLETVREMGLLQKENPGIAIAVKTRHASRAILNQMRDALLELKEDGLVDDKENEILTNLIEENMKRLWTSPSSIAPSPPEVLLANVSWILGNDELLAYIQNHASLVSFNFGDTICSVGDEPHGVYLIISGMIKIHYQPSDEAITATATYGKLPNTELFVDMTFSTKEDDFFSTGTVLGEMGVLTGSKRAATVTSETSVLAYHVPLSAMKKALGLFNDNHDSLESRLWRSCGIRLATALLPAQPLYSNWTVDKIRLHLERSAVPLGKNFESMKFPEFVSDAILVQGQVKNFHKEKEIYTAPCLLPHNCTRIAPHPNNATLPPRLLIVAHEDIDHENVTPSEESLLDYVVKASSMRKGIPAEANQLTSARDRRLSVSLNFAVRKKSQRKLENKTSIKTVFGKRDRNTLPAGSAEQAPQPPQN